MSVADDERVDVQPVLVDQVEAHEGVGEVGAAERQVTAGLGLQRPDLVDVDIVDDHCVPIGVLERAREHDLRHVAPDRANSTTGWGRGILIGGRPVVGHELVGDPSVEERTRRRATG